jgi:hypothetical protein
VVAGFGKRRKGQITIIKRIGYAGINVAVGAKNG